MKSGQKSGDVTRARLIESAGQVFAEQGFRDATVREICARAGAHVAAVNYHFRDKLGLYTEVLKSSIFAQQTAALDILTQPSDPRAALRAFICEWFERASEGGRPVWFRHIMAHEMTHPTAALDRVAEAIGPNYLRLRTLVGKLIGRGPGDVRTRICVHSIVGQILHYMQSRPMLARLWPDLNLEDKAQRRTVANHIAEFSLAGIEGIARRKTERRSRKRQGAAR
jgi:TetR/AcrR family transcriptional regulator, regulator of cefoperazone and chloramphenicol sensitivity